MEHKENDYKNEPIVDIIMIICAYILFGTGFPIMIYGLIKFFSP